MELNFTEFNKLISLCIQSHWNVEVSPIWEGLQVILYDDIGDRLDDAVIHEGSYGAGQGLLETYALSDCMG